MPPPTPTTWVKKYQQLLRAACYSLHHLNPAQRPSACPDGPTLFASLSPKQLNELKAACPTWANASIARLNGLFAAQLFDDWPASDVATYKCAPRIGSNASESFNDEAFSEIIRAAFWLNDLQGDVLQAFLATKDIVETANGDRRHSLVQEYRRESVRSWASNRLQAGTEFPFWIELSGEAMQMRRYRSWPMETVLSLKSLLFRCQIANMIMIIGSTGMRVGEMAGLGHNSLLRRDGRFFLRERSFKNTDIFDGEARQWPLPEVAVRAFQAQVELATTLGAGDRLWVPVNATRNDRGLPAFGALLRHFGRSVGLRDGSSLSHIDGDISPHRFRFTVARLVALSLTGSSQVLFDVLGHDDVETTLGYALQDPELHEDINKIRAEVKAIRVKDVFDTSEEIGGPAAEIVRRTKADMLARSGKDELETDEIDEAAAILGDAEQVKQGVLCTAQPLERGACSSPLGLRDHSACTPQCLHRLELAAAKQDRRRRVQYILENMNADDVGSLALSLNQIVANFAAFPSLLNDFEDDPQLLAALKNCSPGSFNRLRPELRQRLEKMRGRNQ
jgi:integrase